MHSYSTTVILSGAQPPWKPCGTRTGRRIVAIGPEFVDKLGRRQIDASFSTFRTSATLVNLAHVLSQPRNK